jgi:hypothetical protein
MTTTSHPVAAGPGWRVDDVICTAGPHDRPFEERHDSICIAVVTEGSFRYRTTQGSAVLAPGRSCSAITASASSAAMSTASATAASPFASRLNFSRVCWRSYRARDSWRFPCRVLPPLLSLVPVIAASEAARDAGDAAELEERALQLAGSVAAALVDARTDAAAPSRRDHQRVATALRRIETDAHESLSLVGLAREAAMSPYHFCAPSAPSWE